MDRWGRDMDAAAFERVYEAFGEFHSFFAPLFGRSESRDHSRNYLRALLVQSQGTVPGPAQRRESLRVGGCPARAMQRFLTAAPANPSCGKGSAGLWSNAVMSCRMRLGER